jgi:hypothetical protein
MGFGQKHAILHRRPRGSALGATLGLLAMVALAQLFLFFNLQGQPTGADKAGTAPEVAAGIAVAEIPARENAANTLPAELPPVGETVVLPPPSAPRPAKFVANPEPPPANARPSAFTGEDPAVLPREDLKVLVAEAIRLRRDGDMAGAVGKLNTALDSLPGHPRLVFEMASTYEAMGMTERAMVSYRNVAAMGPRAGVLQPIAERRLQDVTASVAGQGSGGNDDLLFLGSVEEVREPSPDGETVLLRFDIQAKPGTVVDGTKVASPVRFFDLVGGNQTEPSQTETPQVRWITPPVDWKEPGIETVEVRYHLPSALKDEGPRERRYLGYVIELRYREKLLDVVSRPRRLVMESPPALPTSPTPVQDLPSDLPEELPTSLGGSLLGP